MSIAVAAAARDDDNNDADSDDATTNNDDDDDADGDDDDDDADDDDGDDDDNNGDNDDDDNGEDDKDDDDDDNNDNDDFEGNHSSCAKYDVSLPNANFPVIRRNTVLFISINISLVAVTGGLTMTWGWSTRIDGHVNDLYRSDLNRSARNVIPPDRFLLTRPRYVRTSVIRAAMWRARSIVISMAWTTPMPPW